MSTSCARWKGELRGGSPRIDITANYMYLGTGVGDSAGMDYIKSGAERASRDGVSARTVNKCMIFGIPHAT